MSNCKKKVLNNSTGASTVEVVIIIAVLVGIALLFRDAIIGFTSNLINEIFNNQDIINDLNSTTIRDTFKIN